MSVALERPELTPELMSELKKNMAKSLVWQGDMQSETVSEAVDIIISAVDKNPGNYEAAARQIKESVDRKFGPSWHVVVGEGYGFEVTHQAGQMIHVFYQGNVAILLYKC